MCLIFGHQESDDEIELEIETNLVTWFCERCSRPMFKKPLADAPPWVQADLMEWKQLDQVEEI